MPDPAEQFHNPYLAMGNSPINGFDPNGEFFLGTVFTGIFEGVKTVGEVAMDFGETAFTEGGLEFWHSGSGEAWKDFNIGFNNTWADFDPSNPGTRFSNAWKIDVGGFRGDFKQIMSRWTWELPQNVVGNLYGHFANIIGRVSEGGYFDGATVVTMSDLPLDFDQGRGLTFGSFIAGEGISSDPFEENEAGRLSEGAVLLRHEYGHYIQSQENGFTYLWKYGIPSAIGAQWTEVDAEFRSDKYFIDNYNKLTIFSYSYNAWYEPVNAELWEHFLTIGGLHTGFRTFFTF